MPAARRERLAVGFVAVCVSVYVFFFASYPVMAQQQQLGAVTGTAENLTNETPTDTSSDKAFGFSDFDHTVKLIVSGCDIDGSAESLVEDGADSGAAKTASGECKLTINFTDNCQSDSKAELKLQATHLLSYAAEIPNASTSASITGSAVATSLGITTQLKLMLNHADNPSPGTLSTTETDTGTVTANARGPQATLSDKHTTTTTATLTAKLGTAATDVQTIQKLPTKTVEIPCNGTHEERGTSTMALATSLTETSKQDTTDFRSFATLKIKHKIEVVGPAVIKHGDGSFKGQLTPVITPPKPVAQVVPAIELPPFIPLMSWGVSNVPPAFAAAHLSPFAQDNVVAILGNSADTLVTIESSDESVVRVLDPTVILPAGVERATFRLDPISAGQASITVRVPSLNFTSVTPATVFDFRNIVSTEIAFVGDPNIVIVQGAAKIIDLNRRIFNNIERDATAVAIVPTTPLVQVFGTPSFAPGEVSRSVSLLATDIGSTTLAITRLDTGESIPLVVSVIPRSDVIPDAGGDFDLLVGTPIQRAVVLSHPFGHEATLTFTSSDESVVRVQPSLTLGAGDTLGSFSLVAAGPGRAVVTVRTAFGGENRMSVGVEACNGIDDDNDGVIDEGCGAVCDVDQNGIIDFNDVNLILQARGTRVGPGDPRDPAGIGMIDVNGARICALRCTTPGCRP